jgi:hypothetical protein
MKFVALSLLLGLWAFAPFSASGTLMQPLSIDELTRSADLIVQGTVLGRTCLRDPEGRIYTKVELQPAEVWKGALPAGTPTNALTIVHGGGTVGNVRTDVSGQVEYSVGEEVVAFLVFNQRGEAVTIGLAQGKFHVWQDKRTGEKFAHNPFHGVPEPPPDAAKLALGKAPESKPAPLAMKELKRQAEGGKP